jgi:hypothetical protein
MRLSAPIYHLKRQAKLLSRQSKIPLHEAQNRIARENGFAAWSLLMSRRPATPTALLPRLENGDMLLIGARPGQGKTTLGLQLLQDALCDGRRAVFFTLEYSEREATERLRALNSAIEAVPEVVASDDICAGVIVDYLANATPGTVAVIDYLQILDQQRTKPALADQLQVLQWFAQQRGVIFGFISQIDRGFDPEGDKLPGMEDVRLPNPVPLGLFTKTWFLHGGEVRLQ